MAKKTKLELTWIGKEQRPRLEPRVLVEDHSKSYHAAQRVSESDFFDSRLIFGDNLLALKALEQEFTGKIKCVFIDPPYNTGNDNLGYPDGVEHSMWLTMMRDRLELLWELLSRDGSIWITIDDNEMPSLRLLLDEVFGRRNFVAQIVWQKVYSVKGSARFMSEMHDYVIVYAKEIDNFKMKLLPRSDKSNKLYKNPDNDPRGSWRSGPLAARNFYSEGTYSITCPSGRVIEGPPKGSYWRVKKAKFDEMDRDGRIYWGKDGNNVPAPKLYLSEVKDGIVPSTIWFHEDVSHNQSAKKHLIALLPDVEDLFITPKPEELLHRIITLTTNPGDWVLDSFAGSGTTGTVAHKMGRKWIMVELGDHCHTHVIPRLKKVIDGSDPGGITEAAGWNGGGGFRYFSLAPSLLQQDQFGNWIINKKYNAELLAQAVCKVEGFTYAPSESAYWQQGHSTERDFIYVTTQTLTRQQIEALAEEVGPNRSLVIYCHAFRVKNLDEFPNLTLKKLPKTVLDKCEWGKDDYSLEIKALQPAAPEPDDTPPPPRKKPKRDNGQPSLFAMEGEE